MLQPSSTPVTFAENVVIEPELLNRLEVWRQTNQFGSRDAVIKFLIGWGLDQQQPKPVQ
jgi:hypothetical protein